MKIFLNKQYVKLLHCSFNKDNKKVNKACLDLDISSLNYNQQYSIFNRIYKKVDISISEDNNQRAILLTGTIINSHKCKDGSWKLSVEIPAMFAETIDKLLKQESVIGKKKIKTEVKKLKRKITL